MDMFRSVGLPWFRGLSERMVSFHPISGLNMRGWVWLSDLPRRSLGTYDFLCTLPSNWRFGLVGMGVVVPFVPEDLWVQLQVSRSAPSASGTTSPLA